MNKSNQKDISQKRHKILLLDYIDDEHIHKIIFSNNASVIYNKKSKDNNFIVNIPGTRTKHFTFNDSGIHSTLINEKYFDLPNELKNDRKLYRQYAKKLVSVKIKKNIKNAIDEQKTISPLIKTESSSKLSNYDIYKINSKKLPEILIKLLYDISKGNKFEYTQLRKNQVYLIIDCDGSIEMIKYKNKKTEFLNITTNINIMNKCTGMDFNHKLYKNTFPKEYDEMVKMHDLKSMFELIQDFILSIKS